MIRTISSLFIILLMLFAIQQWIVTSDKVAVLNEISKIKATESCATIGGNLTPVCLSGKQMCIVKYSDAGKACISGAQCNGECRAPQNKSNGILAVGRCSASNNPCGCWANVEFGIVQHGICAD